MTALTARSRVPLGDLVIRAQAGDVLAINDLLDVLAPYVSRICGPIALTDGPDAVQETLVAVVRAIHQLRDPEALFGWARAIALREAVRVARRSARVVTVLPFEIPAPDDAELGIDIRDTLERLSPDHRAVLVLRHVEGLDEHEISAVMATPEGTVRSRLFRARRAFRKEWYR